MRKSNKNNTAPSIIGGKHPSILLLGLVLLSTLACETVVEVEVPKEAPKLVINSYIGTDDSVTVYLSQSKSVLDNKPIQAVSGAEIVLWEEGIAVATLEEASDPYQKGYYFSPFVPAAGKHYTLRVAKSGYESVEAKAYIPLPVPIQEITLDTSVSTYSYYNGDSLITYSNVNIDEIQLTFTDPADEQNYYELQVQQYAIYYNYLVDEQGNYAVDEQGNYIPVDTTQLLSIINLTSDDPLLIEDEGFFGEDGITYSNVFMFTDDLLNGKNHTLRFKPLNNAINSGEEGLNVVVILRTINENWYQYLISNELQYENEGDPFAEPAQVYNNIENGFGIFAGYSSDQVVFDLE